LTIGLAFITYYEDNKNRYINSSGKKNEVKILCQKMKRVMGWVTFLKLRFAIRNGDATAIKHLRRE